MLFFGCRHEAQDFLYADELRQAEAEGYLTHLVTAFSRDQAHKVYVQHRIKEHQQFIWEVMENNGLIYVCGYASSLSIYLSLYLSRCSLAMLPAEMPRPWPRTCTRHSG